MRASAFRAFLANRLGASSINGYVAYCSRLERELGLNLDDCDLGELALQTIAHQLGSRGVTTKSVSNLMTVARSYQRFRAHEEISEAIPGSISNVDVENAQLKKPVGKYLIQKLPEPQSQILALLRNASVRDLLITHGQIVETLRQRGVVRTGNSPVGDYAELLFARAFGWSLAGNSSAGYDATDETGVRYQIKCRRVTAHNASRQLSALRRLPDQSFDILAGLILDELYEVRRAILIPHALVESQAKWIAHTNSWRFMLEDRVWETPGIRDVTTLVQAAAEAIT